MRQAFAVFIAVVSGTCCSARGPIETDPTKAPDTSKVMALVGRFSVAHGCPISETRVLTSAHVIDQEPGNRNFLYQTFRWSDENGLGGYVVPDGVMAGSDLAVMTSVPPVPSWYTRASVPPAIGDPLWLVEYDFSDEDKAFRAKPLQVSVTRVVAGNVVFKPAGKPGSSGSCVLNEGGELVAIQAWSWGTGWKFASGEVGVAVGVWGQWLDLEEK